jgi:hypothetical protein
VGESFGPHRSTCSIHTLCVTHEFDAVQVMVCEFDLIDATARAIVKEGPTSGSVRDNFISGLWRTKTRGSQADRG